MLAHGTYQLVNFPRGGEFRVHHIQFPNQLLSPQEAVCCIIKRDAFNYSTILKHSSTLKKKKKEAGMRQAAPQFPTLFTVNSFSPGFKSPSLNSPVTFIGEHEQCDFVTVTFT